MSITIKNMLQQIQRMAGDPDGNKSSIESILQIMSDEMRYCANVFPAQLSITDTLANNTLATPVKIAYIRPQYVYVNNIQCSKIYATDMAHLIATNGQFVSGSSYFWSMDENVLKVWPSAGDVRVIGFLKPPAYTRADLECCPRVTFTTGYAGSPPYVPGLTGAPLTVFRYRCAQRVAEEIGDFQRAQYFLQLAVRKEAEVRSSFNDDTTQSIGSMTGEDL